MTQNVSKPSRVAITIPFTRYKQNDNIVVGTIISPALCEYGINLKSRDALHLIIPHLGNTPVCLVLVSNYWLLVGYDFPIFK